MSESSVPDDSPVLGAEGSSDPDEAPAPTPRSEVNEDAAPDSDAPAFPSPAPDPAGDDQGDPVDPSSFGEQVDPANSGGDESSGGHELP